ncbi:hypothetical protein [Kineosporia sp. R_H_3]|uniref:hypothetical protein n=1 Tax=Kineosporia sp. R_H_3 TaxID=1961848 RepID=UPI000B4A58FF|nr:hypothetical protein [Kineosporia sp. R_H_3]
MEPPAWTLIPLAMSVVAIGLYAHRPSPGRDRLGYLVLSGVLLLALGASATPALEWAGLAVLFLAGTAAAAALLRRRRQS